ncbi:hypothetical protein ABMA28_010353 [Loxostege sticticalis]|uniref:CN hydrolase domain-containing protein n=1 Tax=Loxostege sticticalis TaxID=481309 RepID=A0ABD0SB46_LOXSC
MRFSFGYLLLFGVALASEETYRAGFGATTLGDLESYVPLIHEAGKLNVDILVLPSPQVSSLSPLERSCEIDNYDEVVKTLAAASKQARLYVVAHLLEKTRCQNKNELVRSNLVFDREGNIVAVYRKPLNNIDNCTTSATNIGSFATDFGVQFGLLMEEDLVLHKVEDLELKNYVMAGAWSSEIAFLSASQFALSWAFTHNVNLVSSSGVFSGRRASIASSETGVTVAELNKLGEYQQVFAPLVNLSTLKDTPFEDLSQYIIRPLDLTASVHGYKETVCHGGLCCEFYVKTGFVGSKDDEVTYGLAAFDGVRHFDRTHNIGAQTCAVFACAGLCKRACNLGSQNDTNIVFEEISISGNFTESIQYPIILTDSQIEPSKFDMYVQTKQVTLQNMDVENLLTFGLFGRVFSKDTEDFVLDSDSVSNETIHEEMTEFFDYVWIRLRVLLIFASIYVLEMM